MRGRGVFVTLGTIVGVLGTMVEKGVPVASVRIPTHETNMVISKLMISAVLFIDSFNPDNGMRWTSYDYTLQKSDPHPSLPPNKTHIWGTHRARGECTVIYKI